MHNRDCSAFFFEVQPRAPRPLFWLELRVSTWKTRPIMRRSLLGLLVGGVLLTTLTSCGGSSGDDMPNTNVAVRQQIASLGPAANLGHRGSGINFPGRVWAENSINSFVAAMSQGADGVELDVELTEDGQLVVMHDDTLDRTTTCTGCVSAYTLAEVQACRLRNGDLQPTTERPPTLAEVYHSLPSHALVNVELKVYEAACRTPTTGARTLGEVAANEVLRLGVARRTLFSSFDNQAVAAVKDTDPTLYAGLLMLVHSQALVDLALSLRLDAIHPNYDFVDAAAVRAAQDAGLQVNVWTVNARGEMLGSLSKGVDGIITDEPAKLREVLATRR